MQMDNELILNLILGLYNLNENAEIINHVTLKLMWML